jgi:thiamine-phosphate pyrophosphorylase
MRPTVAGASTRSRSLGRLCLVTDHRTGTGVLDTVAAGLAGGVDLVQVRPGPELCDREAYELTVRASRLCRARGVPCLVDDRLDVALAARADGAHVGAGDLPVRSARELLGPDAILGATARDPEAALLAQADGATYVGVGPAHLTRTKDGLPPPLGPAGVGAVAKVLGVPVLAIGGVTIGHVPELLAAGAHGVAVVSALSAAEDPVAAAGALRGAIDALTCTCPACTDPACRCSTDAPGRDR